MAKMTVEEKLGQMLQAVPTTATPDEAMEMGLGSVLVGGSGVPGDHTAAELAKVTSAYHVAARRSRLGIPLLFGIDAVHGIGGIVGATVFPHNIGLGATRDAKLVQRVAAITAREAGAMGIDWTFAPVLAAARDERWGRTYESFSEEPALPSLLGAAAVRGYQGTRLGDERFSLLACTKHFAGDGATEYAALPYPGVPLAVIDRGDVRLSSEDFQRLAVDQYGPAIAAGVGSVMVSYSAVQGVRMTANRELVTGVLKGEMGFRGFVVSDWESAQAIDGQPYAEQVVTAVNAGVDLLMEPNRWREALAALQAAHRDSRLSMERIDDAVSRILGVKCELGLWRRPDLDDAELAQVGSTAHREVARQAVSKSLVLLKNEEALLPLSKTAKLRLAGTGAANLDAQCGGWTVTWMGSGSKTKGTHLAAAFTAALGKQGSLHLCAADGNGCEGDGAQVAVVVASEQPYAEYQGDAVELPLQPADVQALDRFAAEGIPTVVVLLSGRPLMIAPHLAKARAWVAAWLPGSEGGGVTDVLFGEQPFSGKLSFTWPATMAQIPINVGDPDYASKAPLFPFGHGLTYP